MPATTLRSLAFCWFWISASRALRSWLARLLLTGSSVARGRVAQSLRGPPADACHPNARQTVRMSPTAVEHREAPVRGVAARAAGVGGADHLGLPSRRRRPDVPARPREGWWLGLPTPQGAATLRLVQRVDDGEVGRHRVGRRGPQWALDQVPALLGERRRRQRASSRTTRRWPGARRGMPRGTSRAPAWSCMRSCRPSSSRRSPARRRSAGYRALVHRFGSRAPGPGEQRRLWVAPDAAELGGHPVVGVAAGRVDGARSATVVRAARVAGRLEECAGLPGRRRTARLRVTARHRRLDGGGGGAAGARRRRRGELRRLPRGQEHHLGPARRGPRRRRAAPSCSSPIRGHRYRVQRLLELDGAFRPRRGPRMAPRRHLPTR